MLRITKSNEKTMTYPNITCASQQLKPIISKQIGHKTSCFAVIFHRYFSRMSKRVKFKRKLKQLVVCGSNIDKKQTVKDEVSGVKISCSLKEIDACGDQNYDGKGKDNTFDFHPTLSMSPYPKVIKTIRRDSSKNIPFSNVLRFFNGNNKSTNNYIKDRRRKEIELQPRSTFENTKQHNNIHNKNKSVHIPVRELSGKKHHAKQRIDPQQFSGISLRLNKGCKKREIDSYLRQPFDNNLTEKINQSSKQEAENNFNRTNCKGDDIQRWWVESKKPEKPPEKKCIRNPKQGAGMWMKLNKVQPKSPTRSLTTSNKEKQTKMGESRRDKHDHSGNGEKNERTISKKDRETKIEENGDKKEKHGPSRSGKESLDRSGDGFSDTIIRPNTEKGRENPFPPPQNKQTDVQEDPKAGNDQLDETNKENILFGCDDSPTHQNNIRKKVNNVKGKKTKLKDNLNYNTSKRQNDITEISAEIQPKKLKMNNEQSAHRVDGKLERFKEMRFAQNERVKEFLDAVKENEKRICSTDCLIDREIDQTRMRLENQEKQIKNELRKKQTEQNVKSQIQNNFLKSEKDPQIKSFYIDSFLKENKQNLREHNKQIQMMTVEKKHLTEKLNNLLEKKINSGNKQQKLNLDEEKKMRGKFYGSDLSVSIGVGGRGGGGGWWGRLTGGSAATGAHVAPSPVMQTVKAVAGSVLGQLEAVRARNEQLGAFPPAPALYKPPLDTARYTPLTMRKNYTQTLKNKVSSKLHSIKDFIGDMTSSTPTSDHHPHHKCLPQTQTPDYEYLNQPSGSKVARPEPLKNWSSPAAEVENLEFPLPSDFPSDVDDSASLHAACTQLTTSSYDPAGDDEARVTMATEHETQPSLHFSLPRKKDPSFEVGEKGSKTKERGVYFPALRSRKTPMKKEETKYINDFFKSSHFTEETKDSLVKNYLKTHHLDQASIDEEVRNRRISLFPSVVEPKPRVRFHGRELHPVEIKSSWDDCHHKEQKMMKNITKEIPRDVKNYLVAKSSTFLSIPDLSKRSNSYYRFARSNDYAHVNDFNYRPINNIGEYLGYDNPRYSLGGGRLDYSISTDELVSNQDDQYVSGDSFYHDFQGPSTQFSGEENSVSDKLSTNPDLKSTIQTDSFLNPDENIPRANRQVSETHQSADDHQTYSNTTRSKNYRPDNPFTSKPPAPQHLPKQSFLCNDRQINTCALPLEANHDSGARGDYPTTWYSRLLDSAVRGSGSAGSCVDSEPGRPFQSSAVEQAEKMLHSAQKQVQVQAYPKLRRVKDKDGLVIYKEVKKPKKVASCKVSQRKSVGCRPELEVSREYDTMSRIVKRSKSKSGPKKRSSLLSSRNANPYPKKHETASTVSGLSVQSSQEKKTNTNSNTQTNVKRPTNTNFVQSKNSKNLSKRDNRKIKINDETDSKQSRPVHKLAPTSILRYPSHNKRSSSRSETTKNAKAKVKNILRFEHPNDNSFAHNKSKYCKSRSMWTSIFA